MQEPHSITSAFGHASGRLPDHGGWEAGAVRGALTVLQSPILRGPRSDDYYRITGTAHYGLGGHTKRRLRTWERGFAVDRMSRMVADAIPDAR